MTFEDPSLEYRRKTGQVADQVYQALAKEQLTKIGATIDDETQERMENILIDTIFEVFGASLAKSELEKIIADCAEVLYKKMESERN